MSKKIIISIAAGLFFAAISVWIWMISSQFTKLPKDFSYKADVVSFDNFYNEATKQYSGEKRSVTKFSYEVTGVKDGMLNIKNVFDVRKVTGEKIFAVERLYGIDPKTGKHIVGFGDKDRDGYLFAPRDLKKGEPFTYWHINYDGPAQMSFVKEENFLGLSVYRYETDYKGVKIDQTANLTNLPGVGVTRGIELEPHLQIWVEPVTGRMVKYEDDTVAYYYDLKTGERQNPWNNFSNTYTPESVIEQVGIAKKEKLKHTLFNVKNWFRFKAPAMEKIVVGSIDSYRILNIVAKEKGIFTENGLDVEIKEYESGPPEFIDLLAGKIDIAIAAEFVGVRHMFTSQDLKILSQIATHEVFEVIGRKSKGINTPGDLKGKKIGVTRKSAGEFYLGKFLILNNLSLGDITIVDMLPTEMVNHLEKADGVIDAAVFHPRPFNLEQKLGADSISWPVQGGQKTFGLIYSTDGFIKTHPSTIERYLRSLTLAEKYYKEHEQETKDLVASALHYDDSNIQYIWSKFNFNIRLEQGLLLTMEDEARWVIANKLTDKTIVPNFIDFIYADALRKVKLDAVTLY